MKNFYLIAASVLVFMLSWSFTLNAQKQVNHWYFGINAGLDFTTGTPSVVTNGVLNTTEGCASIADSLGNLLFYTDGVSVWNNTHTLMPNGTALNGDVSTTQSALIVRKPGSHNFYFIFTLPAEGTGNFCYSIVDMTMDSGKGDVAVKNTVLKSNVTEKMSAVHHCNGKDIWVTIHELNSNAFYSYKITANGVSTPVISNTGRVHTRVHGQMKFSNNAARLALVTDSLISNGPPYQGKAFLELLNFNNNTGVVTASMSIPLNNWQKAYGVEFSPDNSKIYATYYDISGGNGGNSEIIQYNLSAPVPAASGVTVGTSYDPNILRALQAGPDGKIYLSKSGTPFLCVVNAPNAVGAACSYSDNAVNVDPNSIGSGCMLGLPGFVQSYFHPSFPAIATCTTTTVTPNPTTTAIPGESQVADRIFFDHVSGRLLLYSLASDPFSGEIYSILGKKITDVHFKPVDDAGKQAADLSGLQPGVYIIRCGNGRLSNHRFIIQ
jgi:hypothetical protein